MTFSSKPAGPDDRSVVTPNATTLYGAGFFDLLEEPLIVEFPEITDRYFSFQAMDQYGDYFFTRAISLPALRPRNVFLLGQTGRDKFQPSLPA